MSSYLSPSRPFLVSAHIVFEDPIVQSRAYIYSQPVNQSACRTGFLCQCMLATFGSLFPEQEHLYHVSSVGERKAWIHSCKFPNTDGQAPSMQTFSYIMYAIIHYTIYKSHAPPDDVQTYIDPLDDSSVI